MRVIKAPQRISLKKSDGSTIFLAGSIEQGEAEDWQKKAEELFEGSGYVIFNPRRDDWDPTWEQDIVNTEFRKQVKWKRKALGMAEYKLFYFDPETKSPISLLELGEYADDGNTVVVCPKGFWRKGNLEIFCEDRGIELVETLEQGVEILKDIIYED